MVSPIIPRQIRNAQAHMGRPIPYLACAITAATYPAAHPITTDGAETP